MLVYLPIAEMPVSLLIILGMGAGIGFLSGLFGIGGGFLMTPLLIFMGLPPSVAVASQSAQISASSTTSSLAAWRRGAIDFRLFNILVCGGIVGTALGVWFFSSMRRLGQLDLVIVLSYVTLFLIVGSLMLRESIRELLLARKGQAMPHRKSTPRPFYHFWPFRMRFKSSRLYVSTIPIVLLALFVGFAGAVLGIGGGFILVPALLYLFRVPTQVVVGTSQILILCTTLVALMLHAFATQAIDIVLALLLICGGVFGAQFGARAGRYLRADVFRLLLALLVLAVGLRFAVELVVAPSEPFSLNAMEIR